MISFQNASKAFPDGTVGVDDLSLEVETGSLTVFVGPSGCGKTTSMRMVNKMVTPTSGRVLIDGRDIADLPTVPLRLGIGYVIQHAGLLPHRTVLDNVAQVLRLKGLSRREARARAHEAIERVQLRPELIDRYPSQLSGGQQQRVGVARALAADPPILLMDEPFSAVDPVVREELQLEILRIQREVQKTILFVTHDIDEALRLGDRIAVFAPGGEVQQYAAPETVLTQPANELVRSMVGRDRGFRALSFAGAESVPVHQLPGASDGTIHVDGAWAFTLDPDGRPGDWLGSDGAPLGLGTLIPPDGSLRTVLDAVLSSPAPYAICVDAAGRPSGIVQAEDAYRAVARRGSGEAP
ncbi:ABC transporter ATP-binding protein [Leucobacter sp. CSA2]|uniref:ABC-type quaternary amine transporter n=1 Tax=Leucobacter edaphi TaxID=2796472 RepID=A0A934UX25_9MICO|nr:ABC transporter ATP-binding protein [Leucobacter edaphi]MBK0421580.1 ABC transporter ATP-binding protein [Leucobacter edaphi]